jgi:potassium/hydrogen antiporter
MPAPEGVRRPRISYLAARRGGRVFGVDRLILVGGVLLLIGIASSKLSSRVGLPVLVLFLVVGMLAGTEGPGGIDFDDHVLAHGVGTVALAIILFDGGLRTSLLAIRGAAAPAFTLATAGVLLTAGITGLAAHMLLGLTLGEALLLGAIVGSTDAAAVFSVLRSRGISIGSRLSATVEIESGSNDPMAIFLTIGLIELLTGQATGARDILLLLALQMGLGGIAGWAVGRAATVLINRINLESAGLYPVLTAAAGLLAYGLPAAFGGSGFLSVYIAGIILGNRPLVFQRGILLFHDGAAWLAQITMFVILGLLSFPSQLVQAAGPGLLLGLVLILVARPAAVGLLLLPFRYGWREIAFISWAGLKGAVPIVLALYPLMAGLPRASLLFDVVFFVVLLSALLQGWTLPLLPRALGLHRAAPPEPPITLEITSLKHVEGDIVEYTVEPGTLASDHAVRDLALPDGVVLALIARQQQLIPPRGSTVIRPGDHVFVVLRPDVRRIVDHVFGDAPAPVIAAELEFPLRGRATVGDVVEFYGIQLDAPAYRTLSEIVHEELGEGVEVGAIVRLGDVRLIVREIGPSGRIDTVGLALGGEATS